MNHFLNKIFIALSLIVACFGLTACNGKAILQNVVAKTYTVTVQIEQYVNSIDATNLISKIKSLEIPLNATSTSLKFIAQNISDNDFKTSLLTVAQNIDKIIYSIQIAQNFKIDDVKNQIVYSINKTKETLILVASYVDLDLTTIKAKSNVTLEEILMASEELNILIKNSQ